MNKQMIEINPSIAEAVEQNNGYCPCAIEQKEETKCPCKEFRESKAGTVCHCGRLLWEELKDE